jgi:hypothetical protein
VVVRSVALDLGRVSCRYSRARRGSERTTTHSRWLCAGDLTDTQVLDLVGEEATWLLETAASWPVGTVAERRLDVVQVRAGQQVEP